MISCDRAAELISAELDGELTQAEIVLLEEHLARCAPCRALQADFQALHQALLEAAAHWTAEPPAGLTQQVLDRVRAEKTIPARQSSRRWTRWAPLAAVLALAVIGGSTAGLWHSGAGGGAAQNGSTIVAAAPAGNGIPAGGAAPEAAPDPGECTDGTGAAAYSMTAGDAPQADGGSGADGEAGAVYGAVRSLASPCPEALSGDLPEGTAPVLQVNGVLYRWEGLNLKSSNYQELEDGTCCFDTELPKGYEPLGELSSVSEDCPQEELQLQADFSACGTVYANAEEPGQVYVRMSTDWFTESYVRFESLRPEDSPLINWNGALYRIALEESGLTAGELPEGCVSLGILNFTGSGRLPAASLETNCETDGQGAPLHGREVFGDPSDPETLYLAGEESGEGWQVCLCQKIGGTDAQTP